MGGVTLGESAEDGKEHVCDTLLMCIITTLNQGLRNGGGIGDVLRSPSKTVSFDAITYCFSLLDLFNEGKSFNKRKFALNTIMKIGWLSLLSFSHIISSVYFNSSISIYCLAAKIFLISNVRVNF